MNMPRLTSITSQQLAGITQQLIGLSPFNILSTELISNPSPDSKDDEFGFSVAIAGNYAIIGAQGEKADGGNASSGAAYIYNATSGALIHTLENPNAFGTPTSDLFGGVVAISGNYAAVSALGEDDDTGFGSGKVYIYNVTTGALDRTLNNPNPDNDGANDNFGSSLAISGNYLIVGATGEDEGLSTNSGKAYLFDLATGALEYTLNNPNAFDTPAGDNFGVSVAISDSYVVVGADLEDDAGGIVSGNAYVFDLPTGNLLYTLDNPNDYSNSEGDQFGRAVAISGNYLIVGAPGEQAPGSPTKTNSGKAYIFDVTTGSLIHTLNNPDSEDPAGDFFGRAVSISGNYAVVSAPLDDWKPSPIFTSVNVGSVYVFDVPTGKLVKTIENPNLETTRGAGEYFGYSVGISGDTIIAGSPFHSPVDPATSLTLSDKGQVHVYKVSGEYITVFESWLDDNDNPVNVNSIISPVAMQVNGAFAVNPAVPFDIQGALSGTRTTVTNISANTGTLLELEDNGNSTSFIRLESLNLVIPALTITPEANNVDEGSPLQVLVTTTSNSSVSNGAQFYWTINGRPEDFDVSSGVFTMSGNRALLSITPNSDITTEGAESFSISIRNGSVDGTIITTSSVITINDTSRTPASYDTFTIDKFNYDEGETITVSVTTTGVPSGTTVGYTVSGEVNSSDVNKTSGTITIGGDGTGSDTISIINDLTTEGDETITVTLDATDSAGNSTESLTASATIIDTSQTSTTGQVEFNSPGLYGVIFPSGITSVSAVAIGAGGGSDAGTGSNGSGGGGGGGLGWRNNITVVPGQNYTVRVGVNQSGASGGDSYFIDELTVAGFGGVVGFPISGVTSFRGVGGVGGGFVGDGGGNGGDGGDALALSGNSGGGGGGGAGGYSGNGGDGGNSSNTGGGSARGGGGGGGVSIYGRGATGVGGSTDGGAGVGGNGAANSGAGGGGGGGATNGTVSFRGFGGTGGSLGTTGGRGSSTQSGGAGGEFGAGGGGHGNTTIDSAGGGGAVRIIWGENRAFPDTNTADV
jgi:hypothetical protein